VVFDFTFSFSLFTFAFVNMNRLLFFLLLIANCCSAQVTPLIHGHAHNDYVHTRPLFEALENGFTSIEIDVYMYRGELKVSHLPVDLDKKKNIEQLYLDPIKKVIEQNGGWVYKDYHQPVIFMIDFKTSSTETYLKLKEVLKNYESIITVYKKDSVIRLRPVQILISGRSPIAELMKEDSSFATIDGDVFAMSNSTYDKVITRYSSGWESYFNWTGKGQIPFEQKQQLDLLIEKAHAKQKQIRFYHIPDKPNVWRTLLDAGVDWINTDKLKDYRKFIEEDYSIQN